MGINQTRLWKRKSTCCPRVVCCLCAPDRQMACITESSPAGGKGNPRSIPAEPLDLYLFNRIHTVCWSLCVLIHPFFYPGIFQEIRHKLSSNVTRVFTLQFSEWWHLHTQILLTCVVNSEYITTGALTVGKWSEEFFTAIRLIFHHLLNSQFRDTREIEG